MVTCEPAPAQFVSTALVCNACVCTSDCSGPRVCALYIMEDPVPEGEKSGPHANYNMPGEWGVGYAWKSAERPPAYPYVASSSDRA